MNFRSPPSLLINAPWNIRIRIYDVFHKNKGPRGKYPLKTKYHWGNTPRKFHMFLHVFVTFDFGFNAAQGSQRRNF